MSHLFQRSESGGDPPPYLSIDFSTSSLNTIPATETTETPPSYSSLYARTQAQVQNGLNEVNKCKFAVAVKFIVLTINAIIIPLAMILIGSFDDHCDHIQIWCVLYGSIKSICYTSLLYSTAQKLMNRDAYNNSTCLKCCFDIFWGFLIICFINANITVFENQTTACLAYYFLFWYVTIVWAVIIIAFSAFITVMIYGCKDRQ